MEPGELHKPDTHPFWTEQRSVLLQTLIFSLLIGMLSAGYIRNALLVQTLALVNLFGWGVCMLAWIKADSAKRGYDLHSRFPLALVVFGSLCLIYYLFRSRGPVGGMASMVYFLFFAGLNFLILIISGVVMLAIMVLLVGTEVVEP